MTKCPKIIKGVLDYCGTECFGRLIFATVRKSVGLKGLSRYFDDLVLTCAHRFIVSLSSFILASDIVSVDFHSTPSFVDFRNTNGGMYACILRHMLSRCVILWSSCALHAVWLL